MNKHTEYKRLWRQRKRMEEPGYAEREIAYRKAKYNANLEESRAYFRTKAQERRDDPEKGAELKEYRRKYYEENKDKINATKRSWRESRTPEQREKDNGYFQKLRREHPERLKAWRDAWRSRNQDRIKEYAELNREQKRALNRAWKLANRERLQALENEKYHTDPAYNLMRRMRARMGVAFRKACARKSSNFIVLTGCTEKELLAHLESTFTDGMTWENRSLWHVDHIRPLASFRLDDPEQQKEAFSWKNLQVLWGPDNMSKGARLTAP